MEHTTYLFIDGNYLRQRNDEAMQRVFGVPGDLDLAKIAESAGALRSFFYDCDDVPKDNESQAGFEARSQRRRDELDRIAALRGFHLRPGIMRRGKKPEQKEVDVLLAVDMMTHGFNRNMTKAILITGDLDFRPVVEALVRSGVFVEVWYEKSSAVQDLPLAADYGSQLSWYRFYQWNTQSFRDKFRAPDQVGAGVIPVNADVRARGVFGGQPVQIIAIHGDPEFALCVDFPHGRSRFLHNDLKVLDRYFGEIHGAIQWSQPIS
jgi:uncharacterized LabA/DUF88 family protein